ncbi:MAG: hypothetical protein HYX89_04015, partial [Chloroflexi bacterium]|nr:hypothetical protein [Chloroflexota bacterium]
GTGKSAVGRELAQMLGWEFVDTDELIAARFGKPIDRIFAENGEAVFREAERQIVAEACSGSRRVIAVGGGAVLDPGNREAMTRGNQVVRLEAQAETVLGRLRDGTEVRPLLRGSEPLERIQELRRQREDAYRLFPTVVVTDGLSIEEAAQRVYEKVMR